MESFMAGPFGQIVLFLPIIILGYFLLIRPQQKRAKDHQALITAVKRGDTIVLSSGLIGKVTRVEDAEVNVEIAPSVMSSPWAKLVSPVVP